ncbi:hypothetical protein ScPMuIL_009384 [Solemya velum]
MGAFDTVCSKDEASATGLTTFSVTVHLSQNGKIAKTITNNVIKQIKTSDTWEDLFWDVVDDRPDSDLPSDIEDIFQKAVSVCVSPSSSGERYHPGDTKQAIYGIEAMTRHLYYTSLLMCPDRREPEPVTMATVRELRDFLIEAELDHYYNALKNELKISNIHQLKYVEEEDLYNIGMAKPEMRRLKKFYRKEYPQGTFGKLKKAILTRSAADGFSRPLSPSSPPAEHRVSRPTSYIRPPGKQIIPSNSIGINKTLGEGEFGVVQQGIWTTEDGEKVQVAIKCLSKERMQNGTQEFLKEAGIMQTIDHENITRMFGVVIDKDNSLMLVTELAPMRSLLECIKEQSLRLDFPLPRLCDFAQQICDGMSYLESKRLIHRDLAARNILVYNKNKVKVSDFGLSRALGVGKDYYQSNFSINLKLPIAWCAPECINYLKFTSASDVWAFGVTIWEMFTYGFQPWAGMTGHQILEAIDSPNHQRLEQPDLCPKEFYQLMLRCWDHDAQKRPTFSEMFIRLPQIRPLQVKAVKDFPEITVPKDYLYYKAYDVIIVIDKNPENTQGLGNWKGVLNNGRSGLFDPTNAVPFIEPKTSPITSLPKPSLARKESGRKSSRKIRHDMIGRPQNDLRHTGHIGYDGAIFGDVSFIGDNYDKLPVKVSSAEDGLNTNSVSYPDSPGRQNLHHTSELSLATSTATNGMSHSWISQESLESTSTFQLETERNGDRSPHYQDIDDDSILADFKMPDVSSNFDFGPSFMEEVLKALNEKEAQIQEKKKSPEPKESFHSLDNNHSNSSSPLIPKETQSTPPPLPKHPPRTDSRREPKPEPRKQAKVKPMSASDEKMIDDAMALANDFAIQSNKSHMVHESPPTSPKTKSFSDSDSESESPRLITKLKMSLRRSPKQERKRIFSEEISNRTELDDNVPPEAQEAYNLLVVRGSVKEKHEQKEEPENHFECPASPVPLADTSEVFIETVPHRPEPPKPLPKPRTDSKKSEIPVARTELKKSDISLPQPDAKKSVLPVPMPRPRPEIRVEPTIRPPPPPPPTQPLEETDSKPLLIEENQFSENESEDFDTKSTEKSVESEPIPHMEVLQIYETDASDDLRDESPGREMQISETSDETKSERSDTSSRESLPKFSSFDEEFAEPSPREIMSRLARESRIRRSLDHQRGVSVESEPAPQPQPQPNRNIREPQGIPGKGVSSTNGDEEEVDTNPLRMLRGGAIPIRGGRVGQGNDCKPSLRYPSLQFKNPGLHHSVSVDSGSSRIPRMHLSARGGGRGSPTHAPPVPPRSHSVNEEETTTNPLPLPPRNPQRPGNLNAKPRGRKYPLVYSTDAGASPQTCNASGNSSALGMHEAPPRIPPLPTLPSISPGNAKNDDSDDDDNVFRKCSEKNPVDENRNSNCNSFDVTGGIAKRFHPEKVSCSLEQLGFFNVHDPFWVRKAALENWSRSDRGSSEEISPLMLANYKTSDGVSYEDLLDLAIDRQKNGQEVETMQKLMSGDKTTLKLYAGFGGKHIGIWGRLVKYYKLKQLLVWE